MGRVRASASVTGPSGSGPSSRAPSPYAGPRPARLPASGRQAPPRPRGRGAADDVRNGSSNDPPAAANGPRAASRAVLRVGHVRPLPHRGARRTDPTPAQRHRGPGVTRARSPGRRAWVPRGGGAEGGEVPLAVRTGCRACRARTVRPYRVRVPRTRRRRKALGWDTASSSTFRQLPVPATDTRDIAVVPDGRAWRKCLGRAVSRARSNPPDPASFALSDHGSRITLK